MHTDTRPDDEHRDALRIRRFPALLDALLPAQTPAGAALDAERLHALCAADGLLELLDWSRRGVAADPLACLWLGSLRWYRLVTGRFPDGAPEPPSRGLDAALSTALEDGQFSIAPGSGTVSLRGLASGEMHYPSAPAQPTAQAADALLRVLPLAFVPYMGLEMLHSWADQSLCLTQGDPGLRDRAVALVSALDELAGSAEEPGLSAHVDEVLRPIRQEQPENPCVETLERVVTSMRHTLRLGSDGPQELHPCLRGFAADWAEVTAP